MYDGMMPTSQTFSNVIQLHWRFILAYFFLQFTHIAVCFPIVSTNWAVVWCTYLCTWVYKRNEKKKYFSQTTSFYVFWKINQHHVSTTAPATASINISTTMKKCWIRNRLLVRLYFLQYKHFYHLLPQVVEWQFLCSRHPLHVYLISPL